MHARHTFAILAAMIGLAGTAHADVYASGPVFGGASSSGGTFICRIFNAGQSNVNISVRQIFSNTNVAVPLTVDTCNVALGSTKYCHFAAAIVGNVAHSCRLVANGTDPKLRGAAEVFSSSLVVISALPIE